MKKTKYLLMILIILLSPLNIKGLELNSKNAILINLNTEEVLYDHNSRELTEVASLNKLMTILVSLENIKDLKETITMPNIKDNYKGINVSTAKFQVGDKITYEDLLYGAMMPSGADATEALAYLISKSSPEFLKLMNNKAKSLKMENTVYKNTIGLDEDGQHTTMEDMVKLLKYALKNKEFRTIFTATKYNTTNDMTFISTFDYYLEKYDLTNKYIIGKKTGSEDNAGLCLVSLATHDNNELLFISSKAEIDTPNHLLDAFNIYDLFYKTYKTNTIVKKEDIIKSLTTHNTVEDKLDIYLDHDVTYFTINDFNSRDVEIISVIDRTPSYLTKEGDILGTYQIKYKGKLVEEGEIKSSQNLHFSLIKFLRSNYIVISIIFGITIVTLILIITKLRRNNANKKNNRRPVRN